MHPLPKVVEKYRDSWVRHDIVALTDLFEDKFIYEINGVSRFRNKRELRSYWCKNKLRQQDLDIRFLEPQNYGDGWDAIFSALFYNPARLSITSVTGVIRFELNDAGTKIAKLSERYDKVERRAPFYNIQAIQRRVIRPVLNKGKPFLRPVGRVVRAAGRNLLTLAFVLGILGVVYVNWIHAEVSVLSEEAVAQIRAATPFWFAGAYILQQLMPFFKRKVNPDIDVRSFDGAEDLPRMIAHMRDADFVQIMSGDFSFLDESVELEDCLRRLAFARKLELFSYKTQLEVEEELATKTKSREIMMRLRDERRMHFNCPVKAKVTLIERGGQRQLLFRFSRGGGESGFHMGLIRANQNTGYLLAVVEQMFAALRSNQNVVTPGPTDSD